MSSDVRLQLLLLWSLSLLCLTATPAAALSLNPPEPLRRVICEQLGVSLDAGGRVKPNDPACPPRSGMLIMRSWFTDPEQATHWQGAVCNPPPTPEPGRWPIFQTLCAAGQAIRAGRPLPPEASLQLVAAIEFLLVPHPKARARLLGAIPEARRKLAQQPLAAVPWLVESLEAPSFFVAYWVRLRLNGPYPLEPGVSPPERWRQGMSLVSPGHGESMALLWAMQFVAPDLLLRDAQRATAALAALPEWPPDFASGIPHWEPEAQAVLTKDREARGLPWAPSWDAVQACAIYGSLRNAAFPSLTREMERMTRFPRLQFACGHGRAKAATRAAKRSLEREEVHPQYWCVNCHFGRFFHRLYELPD